MKDKSSDCGCGSNPIEPRSEQTETFSADRADTDNLKLNAEFRDAALRFLAVDGGPEERRREEEFSPAVPAETTTEIDPGSTTFALPRYLSGALVDVTGVGQMTPGLRALTRYPLEEIVANCFGCLAPRVTVCLRFLVVDVCGGRNRKEEGPGILRGVRYPAYKRAPHLGRLSDETVNKIRAIVNGANEIWSQCQSSQIQFAFATNPADEGREFIYAFDPQGVSSVAVFDAFVPYKNPLNDREVSLRLKQTITDDLCLLMDGRNITTNKGQRKTTRKQSIAYGENPFTGLPDLKDLLRNLPSDKASLAETSLEEDADALELFGRAIDARHGATCINVFVLGKFDDTDTTDDEEGFAEEPGRNIFLDEVVVSKQKSTVFAHECGHNFGLKHDDNENNLMHKSSSGTELRDDEEPKQCGPAFKRALTIPGSTTIDNGF